MPKTGIPYLDEVWNPVTGCSPISEGCTHCYAKAVAETRLRGKAGYDQENPFTVTVHEDKLNYWNRGKTRKRIGICFMGDLFHSDVSISVQKSVVFKAALQAHDWFILSKRTSEMAAFQQYEDMETPARLNNARLFWGATCENQARLDERLPDLLKINGNIWLSLEPLLGPIVLPEEALKRPSWVVIGAESGPGRRPCELEWVKSLVKQCWNARVPCFVKQADIDGKLVKMPWILGEQWAQFPEVA